MQIVEAANHFTINDEEQRGVMKKGRKETIRVMGVGGHHSGISPSRAIAKRIRGVIMRLALIVLITVISETTSMTALPWPPKINAAASAAGICEAANLSMGSTWISAAFTSRKIAPQASTPMMDERGRFLDGFSSYSVK